MLIHLSDAHCHVSAHELDDFDSAISSADVCLCACFSKDWAGLKNYAQGSFKKAFGIHPNLQISPLDDASAVEKRAKKILLPELEEYLISADVLGEIGLDARMKERVPQALQEFLFTAQLKLAHKYSLPVVLHCVNEWGKMLEIMSARAKEIVLNGGSVDSPEGRFLIHGTSCSAEVAMEFARIGGYFSFGIRELLSKKGMHTAEIVPADRLLIESDSTATYSTLEETAIALAKIRGVSAEDICELTYVNFHKFFDR